MSIRNDPWSRYWAHLPSGKIIDECSGEICAANSIDKHLPRVQVDPLDPKKTVPATTWLSQNHYVNSMGWLPGERRIIDGKALTKDGWIDSPGDRTFNLYFPPTIERIKDDCEVQIWLDHVRKVYPNEWEHVVAWFAFKVQNPGEKINHGLVFVGSPGIGKDTILEPVIAAIGAHNFKSINAATFFKSDFNGYLQSVLLRIDEVHDLGGESKYAFQDRTKTILAAPPATHLINEKFIPAYVALNVCGVVLTSNHEDALYLPGDDRRHFVCTSDRVKSDFPEGYFDRLYCWFEDGGNEIVAGYLAELDLSAFDAKAPPPKTAGWRRMVAHGLAPEAGDLSDAIEGLGNPEALTLSMIRSQPLGSDMLAMLGDVKRRKHLSARLAEAGYIPVLNPDEKAGRWRLPVSGEHGAPTIKTTIYGRRELSETARLKAARELRGW